MYFRCQICNKSLSKTQALIDHLKNVHGLGTYVCPAPCNQIFNNLFDFKDHTKQHKIESTNECKSCNTQLLDENACEQHLDNHLEYNYNCPICEANIPDKKQAPKHLQTHFENELLDMNEIDESEVYVPRNPIQVGCNICKEMFKTKQDFEIHFTTKHDSQIVYTCGICWKIFTVYNLFSNHCYNHGVKDKFK